MTMIWRQVRLVWELHVAPDDAKWHKGPFFEEGCGSGVYLDEGSLFGNGQVGGHAASELHEDQIITMEFA